VGAAAGDPAAAAAAAAAAKTAVNELLEPLAAHRRRRDFFAHFADHPAEAINQLILNQTREAKSPPPRPGAAAGASGGGAVAGALSAAAAAPAPAAPASARGAMPEEERRAAFYTQPWVHEAIPRYLFRKQIADAARAVPDGAGKEVSVTVVPGPPPRSSMRR